MTMFQFSRTTARFVLLMILTAALPLSAQSRGRDRSRPGTQSPEQPPPPWRFVEKGTEATPAGALVLYWFPQSREEMDHSPLLASRALMDDSVRCVALEAIVPDNMAIIEKLGVTGKLPTAVLTDSHGKVVRRLENTGGVLRTAAVEHMVSEELNARDEAMYRDITEAKRRADAGDKQTAIDLYRRIWDDHCLYPFAGKEAQSALKELGVIVQETVVPSPPDPGLHPAKPTVQPKTAPVPRPPP
jgi:hypothetical protein